MNAMICPVLLCGETYRATPDRRPDQGGADSNGGRPCTVVGIGGTGRPARRDHRRSGDDRDVRDPHQEHRFPPINRVNAVKRPGTRTRKITEYLAMLARARDGPPPIGQADGPTGRPTRFRRQPARTRWCRGSPEPPEPIRPPVSSATRPTTTAPPNVRWRAPGHGRPVRRTHRAGPTPDPPANPDGALVTGVAAPPAPTDRARPNTDHETRGRYRTPPTGRSSPALGIYPLGRTS